MKQILVRKASDFVEKAGWKIRHSNAARIAAGDELHIKATSTVKALVDVKRAGKRTARIEASLAHGFLIGYLGERSVIIYLLEDSAGKRRVAFRIVTSETGLKPDEGGSSDPPPSGPK